MDTDKRQQIMDAVEALFVSRRFHEITIEDVARKAGVGKGTVYRYFADKDELFFQVAMAGYAELCAVVGAGTADSGPYVDVFRRVCAAVSAFYAKRPRVFHLMQAEDRRAARHRGKRREAWRECKSQLLEAFRELIVKGQKADVLRTDLLASEVAGCLLALLRSTGRGRTSEAMDKRSELVIEIFLNGMAQRAPAAT